MGARNYLPFRNIWFHSRFIGVFFVVFCLPLFVFWPFSFWLLYCLSCEYGLRLPFGIFKLFLRKRIFKRWPLLIPYVLYLKLLKEWNKYLQAVNVWTMILVSSNCLAQSHDCKSLDRDKYVSSYWSWNEIVWGFFLLFFFLFCLLVCALSAYFFLSYCFCFCSIIWFVCPILVQNLECVNANHS
jgi:hypothetical protein